MRLSSFAAAVTIIATVGVGALIPVAGVAWGQQSAGQPAQAAPSDQALLRLVTDFLQAQRAFDVAALTELTTPDYLEVSPIGEVDARGRMLSFYAPDKKSSAPTVEMKDPVVRMFGEVAIVVAKLAYAVPSPGQPARMMELRASFVAHRLAGRWKLASAQYTGIRAPDERHAGNHG